MRRRSLPHRPGRPRLPAGRRRSWSLVIRVSGAELEVLRRRAARAGVPVAAYVRGRALRRGGKARSVPEGVIRALGELGRLGHELRELGEMARQGAVPPGLGERIEVLAGEVRALHRLLVGLPAEAAGGTTAPADGGGPGS